MQKEVHEREANEKKPKGDKQAVEHKVEKNLMTTNKACKLDDCKNFTATQEDSECEENIKKLKAVQNAIKCETNGKMVKATKDAYEHKENGKELEATKVTNEQDENQRRKAVCVAQSALEHEENMKTKNAKVSPLLDDSEKKLGRPQVVVGREQNEKNNKASQMAFDLENFESKLIKHQLAHEGGENGKSIKEDQVAFDQEVNESKFEATQVGRQWVDNGKKMEAAQPANAVDEKRNTLKVAREADTRQDTERKEKNSSETPRMEDNEKEEWKQQERKQEKNRLQKMEEEKDKESKREKDRVAVERATRKAHERAFSEASDRTDRAAMDKATAEARQRAMAEAPERLEKASSEAWDNSLAAKDSMEARIMVERAAVERATVEARERAVEKAIAEKAVMEARERAERSLREKVSATLRDSGMKQSSSFSDLQESQFQNSGSSHSSRYPDSLNHGASYASEKFQVAEGESAQRCKARLDRHKRTIERAAKALVEKNMRDLLVQREQAERNRLSEALDADVKRWSSGKEGNLRALLSTLQYILGSDSGWQPIPLTDVITAAGVKKAYRKANLCVHPDKLQQRGASVQQKYICEKVFDLLKEAWNKFNSEER